MNLPRVYLRMQLDIFALFNRSELNQISKASRRFYAIIQKHFITSPQLILSYLHYQDGAWKWSANVLHFDVDNLSIGYLGTSALPMSVTQLAQLPSSKFLRFKVSAFVFASVSNAMDVLKTHSHLWEGGRLVVSMKSFLRSMEFANIVNLSPHLTMVVPGSLRIFAQLLRRKRKHLVITDNFSNPTKQLPVNDIINFIFSKSGSDTTPTCLAIKTRYPPKYEAYEEIVDSIKQKFIATALPPKFIFVKLHCGHLDWPEAHDFTLYHPQCATKLCFKIRERNTFTMTCLSNEMNIVVNIINA